MNPLTGNVDRFKIRCPVEEIATLQIPAATTLVDDSSGSHVAYAGQVVLIEDTAVILTHNIQLNGSDAIAAGQYAVGAFYVPGIVLPSADVTWKAGEMAYYDLGNTCVTNVATNVKPIGIAMTAGTQAAPPIIFWNSLASGMVQNDINPAA